MGLSNCNWSHWLHKLLNNVLTRLVATWNEGFAHMKRKKWKTSTVKLRQADVNLIFLIWARFCLVACTGVRVRIFIYEFPCLNEWRGIEFHGRGASPGFFFFSICGLSGGMTYGLHCIHARTSWGEISHAMQMPVFYLLRTAVVTVERGGFMKIT